MCDCYSVILTSKGLKTIQPNIDEKIPLDSPYARLEVIKRILQSTANPGARAQSLMYSSYLSYIQIDQYLAAMVANGLVSHDRESRSYRITPKGVDFLSSL